MALPNRPVHLQRPCYPVQPAEQALAEPHHVLHVVNALPEEHPRQRQELLQTGGQIPARKDLYQVPKIVRAVERHPTDWVIAHQPRRHHQLGEPGGVHTLLPVPLKVDPLCPEQLDRVRSVGVTRDVEIGEIELPDEPILRSQIGEASVGVGEGETDLDEVQGINVGFQDLVMIGGSAVVETGVGSGTKDETGEFGVHGNKRVVVDDLPYELKLRFQIMRPDLPDDYGFGITARLVQLHE